MSEVFCPGVSTALVTPFKKGELDLASFKNLIGQQLDAGIQGFVVCGSTGEAATLSFEEKKTLVEFAIQEVAGQVPILVGAGTFNTQESCELVQAFDNHRISGFLIVTPYYNKPPQRGLVAHFKKVASMTTKPVVLYNVPGRTAITMSVETVVDLSAVKNIVGIKEAAGDLKVMETLIEKCPKHFSILSGDDGTFIPAMQKGGHGVISVISHVIPKICVEAAQDPRGRGQKSQNLIEAVSNQIFCESNPIPVKWALKEMGVIASSELRLPLVELDEKLHQLMRDVLGKAGVL